MQFLLKFETINLYVLNIIEQNFFEILKLTHYYSHLEIASYCYHISNFLSFDNIDCFVINNTFEQLYFIILKIPVNRHFLVNHISKILIIFEFRC